MNSKTLLLALVPPFCWGTGLALARPAVTHFPPLFMMLLVYSAIAVVMLITVRDRIKTPWRSLLLISAFSVTIQGAFVFWGLRGVEATTANLVLQTQVPIAVFLGWLIAGEELNLRKILGTAIALLVWHCHWPAGTASGLAAVALIYKWLLLGPRASVGPQT